MPCLSMKVHEKKLTKYSKEITFMLLRGRYRFRRLWDDEGDQKKHKKCFFIL